MKDFPLYTQHEAMDCGPTCLRMIAAYYGKRYSLQYLRDISYITKEGVSMLGISEAAERIGLHTIAVEATIGELIKQVPLPCMHTALGSEALCRIIQNKERNIPYSRSGRQ